MKPDEKDQAFRRWRTASMELITTAADLNLLGAISTISGEDSKSALLATLNRVHDQLQEVRNFLDHEIRKESDDVAE